MLNVRSIDELVNVIIPLFDKHSPRSNKLLTYRVLPSAREVVLMMKAKQHLTLEGTLKILELSYFLNKDTTLRTENTKVDLIDILRHKFGDLPKVSLDSATANQSIDTKINLPGPISLDFIRGLVDGDGSFNVSFNTKRRRVVGNFTVTSEIASRAEGSPSARTLI